MRIGPGFAVVSGAVVLLAACSGPGTAGPPVDGWSLAEAVDVEAMVGDLEQLERIADETGGNRAVGTAGYDASVDYVVGQLTDAGFDVETPEFEVDSYQVRTQTLQVGERAVPVAAMTYSAATPPDGLRTRLASGPAAGTDPTPGCEEADYEGQDVAGAAVLVDRGGCPFVRKQQVAADRGAAAILVANNTETGPAAGTLGDADAARIPAAGVAQEDSAFLRQGGDVVLTIDASVEKTQSRNVIAQTRTGDTENVVMAGAHLDSVPAGPGINDNGTGVAVLLETARQLSGAADVTNAVRLAFWGAEEIGLVGSEAYVAALDDAARDDIALYLNFDMVGSANAGYFAYDGDDSENAGAGPGPEGSAGIERTLEVALLETGVSPEGTDFDGRSDYGPFIAAGIPSGGLFTGADDRKTPGQAEQWGGAGDTLFDPNYHTDRDVLDRVDRGALARNGAAAAFGIGHYARTIDGPNGVPAAGDARSAARAAAGE